MNRHRTRRVPPEKEIDREGCPLVFENVSIGFEGKPVLENISFSIRKGETRVLLGPAGSGKSLLLKMANGLIMPDSGAVKLFGLVTSELPERDLLELRGYVGMVFQESALFDSLTVRDNVGYRLEEEHDSDEDVTKRVQQALEFVELGHTMDKFPSELSGGMRRRVAIARAIITKPELILYDSPTGGLDPITSTTIIELVVKQRDQAQTTSIVVTHRLQDAFTMATHHFDKAQNKMVPLPEGEIDPNTTFMVLHEGKVVFDGTTQELVNSQDPFIKEFLA